MSAPTDGPPGGPSDDESEEEKERSARYDAVTSARDRLEEDIVTLIEGFEQRMGVPIVRLDLLRLGERQAKDTGHAFVVSAYLGLWP